MAGILAVPVTTRASTATTWFVHPSGSGTECSASAPCSLVFALAGANGSIAPGDSVRIDSGRYVGCFKSALTGNKAAPIRVEAAAEGRVELVCNDPTESTLRIEGADTWYIGLDVSNGNSDRTVPNGGAGINIYGPRTKVINCFAHDATNAIATWVQAHEVEIYGCITMHAGYATPGRGGGAEGRGYGIYAQSETTATIENNHLLMGFSYGLHAYTEQGRLDGLRIVGNTFADAGLTNKVHGAYAPNILIGGGDTADDLQVRDNVSFHAPAGLHSGGATFDYGKGTKGAIITNNYFVGPNLSAEFGGAGRQLTLTDNTFVGPVPIEDSTAYPSNTYESCCSQSAARHWIRPNKYEVSRTELTIVNWDRSPTVTIPLAPGTYEIRSAFDYWGKVSILESDGMAQVPMTDWQVQAPRGAPTPRSPGPLFGDFVLRRTSEPGPPPSTTPPVSASTVADPPERPEKSNSAALIVPVVGVVCLLAGFAARQRRRRARGVQ